MTRPIRFVLFVPQRKNVRPLAVLAKIPTIRVFGCSANKITDAGLAHLTGMKHLAWMEVAACRGLTDRAFEHLDRIENLRYVSVVWTSFTEEAVEKFKKRRPECHVVFDTRFH